MEPFSTVAAAISLAPIALQVGLKLYNTISKVKGISAELRRLNLDLKSSMQIVSEIQNFCNTHGESGHLGCMNALFENIGNQLKSFLQDMAQLQLIIENSAHKDEMRINRFGMMVKSILNEQKIMGLSSRLAMHKASLQLALITLLGYDGQAIKMNLSHVVKDIYSLRDGQTTLLTQMAESSAKSESNFSTIRKGMNTLESLIRDLDHSRTHARGENGKAMVILRGSAADAVASLDILCPEIRRLLLSTGPGFNRVFPESIALWFLSQLYAIFSDVLEGESQKLMPWPPDVNCLENLEESNGDNRSTRSISPLGTTSRESSREIPPHRRSPKSLARGVPIETVLVEANTSTGNVAMIVKRESFHVNRDLSTKQRIVGRALFVPKHNSTLAGITAKFTRYFHACDVIPRTLSTFCIHLDASPVFEYIKAGDTPMIRKMLSEHLISPNDRDQKGNSLLWYAVSHYTDYNMCRVLLNEGAEASDCNRYGDHALAILMRKLPTSTYGRTNIPEDVLSLTRHLINCCRGEASSMCLYKRSQTDEHAEAGLFHCVLSRFNCEIRILELVKLILENNFDLEARDVNGNTPLLYAMYYTPQFELVEVVNTLIKAGANVGVTNKYGEGCLHLLLRRLSACNNYKMCDESRSSVVDILVLLIDQGCDPTLGSVVGYTPVDAALSPTALPLFFSALQRAKKNIKNALLTIDDNSGIIQVAAEVQEMYARVLRRATLTAPKQSVEEYTRLHIDGPCYLCHGLTEKCERQIPFDEFTSQVVEELGFGIHMALCKHYDGEECLKVQEEDSCHFVDYHPDTMSYDRKRKRSLNRHVAYMMWRDDILRTPRDCHRWAVRSGGQ